jgi:putative oxidoreductase
MNSNKNLNTTLLLLRVAIGFPMLIYGLTKLTGGIESIFEVLQQNHLPSLIGYGVYLGEIVAPVLIILGVRARIAGVILSFNCIIALLLTQTSQILMLNAYGGWAIELLFIFILLGISLYNSGAGQYAISKNNKWD